MKSMSIFTISVAAFLAGALHAEDLDLDRDKEIVVNDGQVISYDALTGGAFTLTKKGGGTLMFKTLANQNASIVLDGGTLKVSGETVAPAALTHAIFAVLRPAVLHVPPVLHVPSGVRGRPPVVVISAAELARWRFPSVPLLDGNAEASSVSPS